MSILIGQPAPDFCAQAVVEQQICEKFTLSQWRGQYVVLFFYPLDFTFVCPTELHAFQAALPAFKERHTQVIACSVDSCYSHRAWLSTPPQRGGIQGVTYPLVADLNKTIAQSYGVLHAEEGVAYRGLFLIDRQGIIRHQVVNDLPIGRSVEETLRTLDALQAFERQGSVCPANWKTGSPMLEPTQLGVEAYFTKTPVNLNATTAC
jgi:peroxiredoxin (alkyl hydroperoxide reductase subunit C)